MPTLALKSVLPSVRHLPIARTDSEIKLVSKLSEEQTSAMLMMDQYERDYKPAADSKAELKKKTGQSKDKQALIKKGKVLGNKLFDQHQKLRLLAKQKKTEMLGLISPKTVSNKNIDYIDSEFKASLAQINTAFMGRKQNTGPDGLYDDDDKALDLSDNYACLLRSLQILYGVVDVKILDWLHVGTTEEDAADPENLFKLLDTAENNESSEGIAAERGKEKMRRLVKIRNEKKDGRDECKESIEDNEKEILRLEGKLEKIENKIREKIHKNNSQYKYAKKIKEFIAQATTEYTERVAKNLPKIAKLTQENIDEAQAQVDFNREIKRLKIKIVSRKSKVDAHRDELEYYQKLQRFIKVLLGHDAETGAYNPMRVELIKSMMQEIMQPAMQELEIIEDLRARTHTSMEHIVESTNAYDMQESKFWRIINGVKTRLEKSLESAFVLKEDMA